MNVSVIVKDVVESGYATYTELSTVLGLEDAMNLLEIHQVNEYNKRLIEEIQKDNRP
ncbi:TPA: hypothetical protein OUE28_003482 [Morganella morganii]|uniref:hypothetical protein n=1 Tax=Morganella morganii TaxID=582 RepID=UPI000D9558C2|nr:hypothetical protein [Morganella morganii]SSN07957.1 Uncharacterised protein [Klebsiella pneumoniae]EJG2207109.1 hypothetical protein [Morganella morganii]EKL3976908.1 hypothetical protein [Morganella morganii]EKU5841078.1 hypothetical protein [Morganella morganii]MBC4013530.1 hypothetical protein [Morganella morganii]